MNTKVYKNRRITSTILVITIAISSILSIFSTGTQLLVAYNTELDDLEGDFQRVEKEILRSLAAAAYELNQRLVEIQLEGIVQSEHFNHVAVIVDEYIIKGEQLNLSAGVKPASNFVSRTYPLIYTKESKAEELGKLVITADLTGIY